MFLVILKDRHIDDQYTLCKTQEAADKKIEEIKAMSESDGRSFCAEWSSEKANAPWTRYWRTDDDGPSIIVEEIEVES